MHTKAKAPERRLASGPRPRLARPGAIPEETQLVAAVIAAHPHVAQCRIAAGSAGSGFSGNSLGPRVRAEVVLEPGVEADLETVTGLAQWCLGRLPPKSRPAVFALWQSDGSQSL